MHCTRKLVCLYSNHAVGPLTPLPKTHTIPQPKSCLFPILDTIGWMSKVQMYDSENPHSPAALSQSCLNSANNSDLVFKNILDMCLCTCPDLPWLWQDRAAWSLSHIRPQLGSSKHTFPYSPGQESRFQTHPSAQCFSLPISHVTSYRVLQL